MEIYTGTVTRKILEELIVLNIYSYYSTTVLGKGFMVFFILGGLVSFQVYTRITQISKIIQNNKCLGHVCQLYSRNCRPRRE